MVRTLTLPKAPCFKREIWKIITWLYLKSLQQNTVSLDSSLRAHHTLQICCIYNWCMISKQLLETAGNDAKQLQQHWHVRGGDDKFCSLNRPPNQEGVCVILCGMRRVRHQLDLMCCTVHRTQKPICDLQFDLNSFRLTTGCTSSCTCQTRWTPTCSTWKEQGQWL